MNSHPMELAVLTRASTTGKISPQALTESRLQLHHAVQYIAATGAALAEALLG